jgi:hypothetical protein
MHLSTSNSRGRQAGKFHIVLLLLLCVVFCAAVEGVTKFSFGRVSRVEKRRETEYRAAFAIQSAKPRHKTSVLVAGNSLLLHGVDFPELERTLGPDVELNRAVFENSFYFDWYYGLRRLFYGGARPDVVALVFSPWQLINDSFNGDYSIQMLVDRRDLLRFASDTGVDRNEMSVMVLDKASYFYGTRAEIRNWVLNKMLPDLPLLTKHFRFSPTLPADNHVSEIASNRLRLLRELCNRYGAEFVLVVPPAREDSGISAIAEAAASQGVPALIPVRVLPGADYADTVHLNPEGAAKFTPALAESLKATIKMQSIDASVTTSERTPERDVTGTGPLLDKQLLRQTTITISK